MKKQLPSLFILLLCSIMSISAQSSQIKGVVKFSDESPAIATLQLQNLNKELIKGVATNPETGAFSINGVGRGEYILITSSLGYKSDTMAIKEIKNNLDVGIIVLQSSEIALDQIVVTASAIKSFASKDHIIIPTAIKNSSSSGYDALKQLPQFTENIMSNKLETVDRKSIKILIDGMEAAEGDLMTLTPANILRLEYYSQPPIRYANMGLGAVINVITVANQAAGSSYMINALNSVTTGNGTNNISAKFYNAKNQFDIRYFIDYRDLNDNRNNQEFDYTISGIRYRSNDRGMPGSYIGQYHIAQAKYIHTEKENYTLAAKFTYRLNPGTEKYSQNTSVITQDLPPVTGTATKDLESNYGAFGGDLYFSKIFKNNQELIANVVGTYYDSRSTNHLTRIQQDSQGDYDYVNQVDNKSASIIAELLYNKKFGSKHDLTVGGRFFYKTLDQEYNATSQQRIDQSIYYFYAGLSGSFNRFGYNAELGVENSNNQLENQGKTSTQFTVLKPSISLNYNITDKSSFRLISAIYSSVPEVSLLTTSPVYINYNYISVGNANLKPYYQWNNRLQYQLNVKNFYLSTSVKYSYLIKPYLTTFFNQGDMIVRTWDVKKSMTYAGADLNLSWTPFKWLNLQPYFSLVHTKFTNNDNTTKDDLSKMIAVSATFSYQKFKLLAQYGTSYTNLYGDYVEKQMPYYIGELSWKHKSLTLALQYVRNPNPTLTYSNTPVIHLREELIWNNFRNMVALKLVYSFSRGQKNTMQDNQKLVNADNDSGLRKENRAK